MRETPPSPRVFRPALVLGVVLATGFAPAGTRNAQAQAPPTMVKLKPVRPGQAPPNPYPKSLVARGRTLVLSGGCNDCHTPWRFDPELGALAPDWTRMLSGHPEGAPDPQGELGQNDVALIGPTFTSFRLQLGTTYSMNLTPDIDTGTGSWTEEMFVDIFRKGRHLGGNGRPVYPPMPWEWIRYSPDEDLRAIFAYLRSIPPIRSAQPDPKAPPDVLEMLGRANAKSVLRPTGPR